jgi:hypothetical protein
MQQNPSLLASGKELEQRARQSLNGVTKFQGNR